MSLDGGANGAFLQMFIVQAEPYMNSIGQVGKTLASGWQSTKATIDGAAGGLGADEIGQAFARGFLPACDAVRKVADELPAAFENLQAGGNQAIQHYALLQRPGALLNLLNPSA